MEDRLITIKEVRVMTGLGPSMIYQAAKDGRFPKQIHPFGTRHCARWSALEVQEWIAEKKRAEAE